MRVEVLQLGVGAKTTAGQVDGFDVGAQGAFRLVCLGWILHDDGGCRAQCAKRALGDAGSR
jgi:hypothetical protein